MSPSFPAPEPSPPRERARRVLERIRSRLPATRVLLVLAALAVLAAACGRVEQPQNALDPKGPDARTLDRLWDQVFALAVVVFVIVQALVLYVVVRFRRRSDDEAPKQVHGNARLEIGWTVAPALLLLVVGVSTLGTLVKINRAPAQEALAVRVIGHQWWWEYEYPRQGITTANELHIPTGRPVALQITAEDVVHSFWPPKLAGKLDAIPGRVNRMTLQADRPGVYHGQCAEFCGLSHANMGLRVVAHTPEDFERWVQDNTREPAIPGQLQGAAAEGAALFRQKGCGSCHAVGSYAAGTLGPDLTHFRQRDVFAGAMFETSDVNLRRWLRDPPKEKPGSIMPNLNLSEDEITKLIAFLNTLE